MQQARLQPFAHTCQQLSALLCNTALSIQTTDYTIAAAWAALIGEVHKTFRVFKNHADKERDILFPVLHEYEPALVAILRDDQCYRMRYLNDLAHLFNAMQAATDKHKSKLFSHKLVYRLHEFVAAAVQQMHDHESMINAVLWRYFSDKELGRIAAAFAVAPAFAQHKTDTSFADNIISHIIPATGAKNMRKHYRTGKVYGQHHTSKALVIAI